MSEGFGFTKPSNRCNKHSCGIFISSSFESSVCRGYFAYSQDSNSNHNKVNSIIYYDIFSDLSRNFTGTVDKLKHNNNNNNNNFQQDSGNTRH